MFWSTISWVPLSPPLLPLLSGLGAPSVTGALRARVTGGIAKDLGCSAVPPACFPPVLDWEVQCEGRQLGLRHCGEFILKCCPHKREGARQHRPAQTNQAGTAICQRYRNMQSSQYLLPGLPTGDFSLCQSCTLHGFALTALGCFCFCGWF